MRFYEISSGLRVPVSAEEQEIFDLMSDGKIKKSALDERQQEVARVMVSRGLLIRDRENGEIVLRPDSASDLWRI